VDLISRVLVARLQDYHVGEGLQTLPHQCSDLHLVDEHRAVSMWLGQSALGSISLGSAIIHNRP
jgi:hypothetical protein